MYMNNPTPNNRRNIRRIAVLLAIVLALLLCLRLCKRETTEEPTPPPTHQQTLSPKATTQHNNKDTCAIAQGKAGRHAKLGGRRKVGKVQHLDKPATRKPRKKNVTADEKITADVEPTTREQTERPTEQQPKRLDESQPEPSSEQKTEPQDELPTIENGPAVKERKNKSKREPMKRISVRYKGHTQSSIGIRAGAGYASIGNLGAMIEDGNIRPRYTLEEHGSVVPTIGLFVLLRRDRLGIELAADYTWLASTLKEHKLAGNIHEETNFRYHVLIPQVAARLYLLADFYMGAGVGLALPFNPSGIDFTSDRLAMFASADELTQAHLRETLRAKLQVMPLVKVGYSSFKNGIEAYLQYGYGLTDLIKTNDNPYGYHTARNNSHLFLLTVGYTIPIKLALKHPH